MARKPKPAPKNKSGQPMTGAYFVRKALERRARRAAETGTSYRPYFEEPEILAEDQFAQQTGEGDFIPLTYDPTNTTWPANGWDHRRTTRAGYNAARGILRIQFFTDGSLYDYGTYKPVPPAVARAFRRAESPGQFINAVLEGYGYERIN